METPKRQRAWPLTQRPLILAVLLISAVAGGIIIGERLLTRIAVAAGILAAGLLISLATSRALAAGDSGSRAAWLVAFYLGQVGVIGGLTMAIYRLAGDPDWHVGGLVFPPAISALYLTWDLWRDTSRGSTQTRLPQFGVADRSSRKPGSR